MKTDPVEITAITLIDKVLEFTSMTPDTSSWTFEKLNKNESRLVRLRQIDSLLKLFVPEIYNKKDLKFSIESLLDGKFIRLRKETMYSSLFRKMDKIILKSKHFTEQQNEWRNDELEFNYRNLIDYKIKINKVLNFNNGIMEISYPYLYSYEMTNSISHKIKTENLDAFLSLVIDPANECFAKEKLIQEYDYPKEDVYEVDFENW